MPSLIAKTNNGAHEERDCETKIAKAHKKPAKLGLSVNCSKMKAIGFAGADCLSRLVLTRQSIPSCRSERGESTKPHQLGNQFLRLCSAREITRSNSSRSPRHRKGSRRTATFGPTSALSVRYYANPQFDRGGFVRVARSGFTSNPPPRNATGAA